MRATRASRNSRRWRGRRHWPALRSACRRWPGWTCCRRSRQPHMPWWSAATAGASLTKTAGCSGTARKASRCAEGAAAHLFAAVLLQNWRLLGDWRPTKSASRGLMCSCQEPSVHSAGRVCSSCWSTALQRSNPSGLDRAWAMVAPHVAKQPKTVPWAPTAHVPPRPPPRTALPRTRAPMLRSSAWPVRCLPARLIHPDTPSSG